MPLSAARQVCGEELVAGARFFVHLFRLLSKSPLVNKTLQKSRALCSVGFLESLVTQGTFLTGAEGTECSVMPSPCSTI